MASKDSSSPAKTDKKLAAATAEIDRLTAQVKTLRKRVKTLETESDAWRKKSEKHRSRVETLKDQADRAIAEATSLAKKRARSKADKRLQQVIADHARDDRPTVEPVAPQTVVQLRVAAKAQGVAGYSRMRKDQLLAALR